MEEPWCEPHFRSHAPHLTSNDIPFPPSLPLHSPRALSLVQELLEAADQYLLAGLKRLCEKVHGLPFFLSLDSLGRFLLCVISTLFPLPFSFFIRHWQSS